MVSLPSKLSVGPWLLPCGLVYLLSTALAIARGEVTVQAGGVARLLGHVAECCRAAAAEGPGLFYAPGHVGVTGNEIADVVAKAAAAGVLLGRFDG